MKHRELREHLAAAGWTIYDAANEAGWYAWLPKRQLGWRDCESNNKPPCFVVQPHVYRSDGNDHGSAEIMLTGEAGGVWYSLRAYGVPLGEVIGTLPATSDALGRAWNGLVA